MKLLIMSIHSDHVSGILEADGNLYFTDCYFSTLHNYNIKFADTNNIKLEVSKFDSYFN